MILQARFPLVPEVVATWSTSTKLIEFRIGGGDCSMFAIFPRSPGMSSIGIGMLLHDGKLWKNSDGPINNLKIEKTPAI